MAGFQERRSKVTSETVASFMAQRKLEWQGNPKVPRADLIVPVSKPEGASGDAAAAGEGGDGKLTKNQMKKILKEQQIAAKKAEKAKEKAAKEEAGP